MTISDTLDYCGTKHSTLIISSAMGQSAKYCTICALMTGCKSDSFYKLRAETICLATTILGHPSRVTSHDHVLTHNFLEAPLCVVAMSNEQSQNLPSSCNSSHFSTGISHFTSFEPKCHCFLQFKMSDESLTFRNDASRLLQLRHHEFFEFSRLSVTEVL